MTREYVRVHIGLLDDLDYMALSVLGKAAWHTINMLQADQTTETFQSRPQIVALLQKEGFTPAEAAKAWGELEGRWIINDPDSLGVTLKGFARWQAPKRNQYYRDYRARRSDTQQIRTESSHVPYRTIPEGVQGEPTPPTPEEQAAIDKAKADIAALLAKQPRAKRGGKPTRAIDGSDTVG